MKILSLLLFFHVFAVVFCGDIVIESASRTVYLQTHVVRIHQRLKIRNERKEHVDRFSLAYPNSKIEKIGLVVATLAGQSDQLKVTEFRKLDEEYSTTDIILPEPLEAGGALTLDIMETLMKYLSPLPQKIRQNENQKLLFSDSMHIISPYVVEYQSSQLLLPSPTVEKYTQDLTASIEKNTLSYGPFSKQEAFMNEELMVHFNYNNAYIHINSLVREVEISHWGNLAIEEHYVISHAGAELKEGFSRIDFQRLGAPSHFRAVRAMLPIEARDIYFRDRIGNISTSTCAPNESGDKLMVDFSQRFPLFGGWKTTFYIGYNLPLKDYLSTSSGVYKLNTTFSTPFPEAPIDDMTLRVIIPEGSSNERIELPYLRDFDLSEENRKTYLDTFGRKVLVVKKQKVVPEQNRHFQVYYNFSSTFFLFEPLLVICGLFVICLISMVYVRLDFTISKTGDELVGERLKVIDEWCTQYVLMNYDRETLFELLEDAPMDDEEKEVDIIREEFEEKFEDLSGSLVQSISSKMKRGKVLKELEKILSIEEMTSKRFEKQMEIIVLEKEEEGEEQKKGFFEKRNRLQEEYDDLKDNILDTLELLK